MSMNEQGTHAVIAGREIFKTVRVDEGSCTEDVNIRFAIRAHEASTSTNPTANTRPRDAVEIHDVAWAKGQYSNFLAAASYNGPIILYDLARLGIEVARLFDHRRQVHRVTFNPHAGHMMLSASQDGTVRLWDLRDCQRNVSTFKSHFSIPGQNDGIRDVKWSPTNGTEFALGTDSGWIQKWDLTNPKAAKVKIAAHSVMCSTIDWHPDGKHLLSASADKSVKVWNLAIEGRRQKAAYEIKTPYPLRNARWRPPCQSSLPRDHGARQCTQLVTSYEKDYPLVHIWDLRRPMLPFRELECYDTAPTDLLWHSQDLLWTVGREGTFLQSDITYAPKVIEKRNGQACAISPLGEINHITQRRSTRPRPILHRDDSNSFVGSADFATGKLDQTVIERMARGSADDSLDETFLSAHRSTHKRSASVKESKSLTNTPPATDQMSDRTLRLDAILSKRKSSRPSQAAARGLLPGAPNALLITYFAQKYKTRPFPQPPSVDDMLGINGVFEHNAKHAQLASMYRAAQSWRIVGEIVTKDLGRRAAGARKRRIENRNQVKVPNIGDSPILERARKNFIAEKERGSKPGTPRARPSLITDAIQSTSNVPTPLARPTMSISEPSPHNVDSLLPDDLDHDGSLALPPSMLSPLSYRTAKTTHHHSPPDTLVGSGSESRDDEHIAGRAIVPRHWRAQQKEPLTLEPHYGNGVDPAPPRLLKHNSEESFGMFPSLVSSRHASLPDSLESSKSQLMNVVHENLMSSSNEESLHFDGETTPDIETNNPSGLNIRTESHRSESLASEISPPLVEIAKAASNEKTNSPEVGRNDVKRDVFREMQTLARNNQESFSSESEALSSQKDSTHVPETKDLEASGTIVQETTNKTTRSRKSTFTKPPALQHFAASAPAVFANASHPDHNDDFLPSDFFATEDDSTIDQTNPFTLITLLQKLLTYHTTTLSDAQGASYLLLLLTPLLPQTHPLSDTETDVTLSHYTDHLSSTHNHDDETVFAILASRFEPLIKSGLQPLWAESILSTYHTQLLSLGLLNEAAYLARLSYPTYPAVYEQGMKDVGISTRCGGCKKPIVNPKNRRWCESCERRQRTCGVCWSVRSPFELAPSSSSSSASGAAKHRKIRRGQGREVNGNNNDGGGGDGETDVEAYGGTAAPVLYSTCLKCNHATHTACLGKWHRDNAPAMTIGFGIPCPTAGCLCDCVAPSPSSTPSATAAATAAGKSTPTSAKSGGAAAGVGGADRSGGKVGPAAAGLISTPTGKRVSLSERDGSSSSSSVGAPRRRSSRGTGISSRVTDDDWTVNDSKAVGSVRRSLGKVG